MDSEKEAGLKDVPKPQFPTATDWDIPVEETDGTFTGQSNEQIYYHGWAPTKDLKGVVLLAHGLAEHSGRYTHLARRLVGAGYAMYATDHMGHGRSTGVRALVPDIRWAANDLFAMGLLAKSIHKGKPRFVFGHSFGGAVALRYALDRPLEVDATILSAPAVAFDAPWYQVLAGRAIARVMPKLPFLQLDATAVSRDPAVVAAYEADPLNYRGKIPVKTLATLIDFAAALPEELMYMTMPMLIMQGGADRLVSPRGAHIVYDRSSTKNKELKVWDGLYHEILNEPEQGEVMDVMLGWIRSHTY